MQLFGGLTDDRLFGSISHLDCYIYFFQSMMMLFHCQHIIGISHRGCSSCSSAIDLECEGLKRSAGPQTPLRLPATYRDDSYRTLRSTSLSKLLSPLRLRILLTRRRSQTLESLTRFASQVFELSIIGKLFLYCTQE